MIPSLPSSSSSSSSAFEMQKESEKKRGSGEVKGNPVSCEVSEEMIEGSTGWQEPGGKKGAPMGWREFVNQNEHPLKRGDSREKNIGFLERPSSRGKRRDSLGKRGSGEIFSGRESSGEGRGTPIEKLDSRERRIESLAKRNSEELLPGRRGSGEGRGTPVGRRGSGERRMTDALGREDSFEIKRIFSRNRNSDLIVGDVELSGTFSISPRNNPLEMDSTSAQIRHCIGEKFPALLVHALAQVSCKKYMYLSPDGIDLATGLQNAGLLEMFFSAVENLTVEKSPSFQVKCRRILEMGLRVIGHPHLNYLLENPEIKVRVERILSEGSEKVQTPRFQELILRARGMINMVGKIGGSSKEIAEEGLQQMSESISASSHRQILEDLTSGKGYGEQLTVQKAFLLAVHQLFIRKKKRAHLGSELRISLLDKSLRMLTFPDIKPLFEVLKVKKIGEKILATSFKKFDSPATRSLVETARAVIQTPPISLKGLQLLLFWTQTDFPLNEETLDLIAGIREWDTDEHIYRFAIYRFMEMSQLDTRDPEVLVRLLQFVYYWRLAPANQDEASSENVAEWNQLLVHLSDPKSERLKKELPEELLKEILSPREAPPEIHSPKVGGCNPFFHYDFKEVCAVWKKKTVVKELRDSIIFYLLQSRLEVSVADLVSSKNNGEFISVHTKRSNRVTQFLASQIEIAARRSLEEARQMIETLSLVQKELIKVSAFEAEAAVYAVFRQPSIKRLCTTFRDSKLFSAIFENREIEALHGIKKSAKELKDLQDSRQKEGHAVFESSTQSVWNLVELRRNDSDFTEKGIIDTDRLKMFGAIFNRFATRREQAFQFWFSEGKLQFNSVVLMAFDAQTGEVGDEAVEDVYELGVVQIRSFLGENFPGAIVYILADVSCNQYAPLSPDEMDLAIALEKGELLKPFLLAVERLTSQRSPLSQIKQQRILEMGLRMIGHPRIRHLFNHPEIQLVIDPILSMGSKWEGTPRLWELVSQVRNVVKADGKMEEPAPSSSSTQVSSQSVDAAVETPAILLRDLQFLAFWIQADLPLKGETLDLIAGLRRWDPDENIYWVAMQRFMKESRLSNRDSKVLLRLLELVYCWRLDPANRDAPSKPSIAEWKQLVDYLKDPKQEDLKKEIPKELLQKILELSVMAPKINLPAVEMIDFSVNKASLGESIPEVHGIWKDKEVVELLRDSAIFFFLEVRQQTTVPDLFFSKEEAASVSLRKKRFNQFVQFLVGQLLGCGTLGEARAVVRVICRVQKELINRSAFEAAGAVYAALQQASIGRLHEAFQDIESFTYFFESAEMKAVYNIERNGVKLRALQASGQKNGDGVLESLSLILWDLEHFEGVDDLAGKGADFIIEGVVNTDKLKMHGRLPNQFAERKLQALEVWTSSQKLQPNPFFLTAFDAQSGVINEAVANSWFLRSQVIYRLGAKQHWV